MIEKMSKNYRSYSSKLSHIKSGGKKSQKKSEFYDTQQILMIKKKIIVLFWISNSI